MIEAIEAALRHWGEQNHKAGSAGGLGSMMGTIIEYGGCAPRGGVPGARILLAGAGPDHLASEVGLALATVQRTGEDGQRLWKLACKRYGNQPELALCDQLADLELTAGATGERAYYRLLHKLHEQVEAELRARAQRARGVQREARVAGDRMRKAARTQARKAHAQRGVELYKGSA